MVYRHSIELVFAAELAMGDLVPVPLSHHPR